MAGIRVNKLCKQFGVGMKELVSFLNAHGFVVSQNPNDKVPEEAMRILKKEYGKKEKSRFDAEYAGPTPKKERASDTQKKQNGERKTRKTTTETISKWKTHEVRIKAINRPSRIITEPFGRYAGGVLFPKDILFRGKPVSICIAELFIAQNLKPGSVISCIVTGLSPDGRTAYLTYELPRTFSKGLDVFEELKPGKHCSINLAGVLKNYFLVTIGNLGLHGVILKNQIDDSIKPNKDGSIRVQLVEKPQNPFQLMRFVRPIAAQKQTKVENLDEIVNLFLDKPELDVITPEGLEVVKSILSKFPKLKRKEADKVTGIQLYCRIPEKSQMQFIKENLTDISKHSFWVSVNLDDDEPSIVLFKERPTIVIELKAYSDDVFTVDQFDYRMGNLTRIILQKYNRRTRLKIAGTDLHFVTRYDPVPLDYNTEEIIEYLGKLYEFNSSILPSIYDAIREKTLLSSRDYGILSSFLKYQRSKEIERENETIFIEPRRISTSSGVRIGDNPSLRLRLADNETKTLVGSPEEEYSALHVAIVNTNGDEILTGVLDSEGEYYVLRPDHGHIDLTEYLNTGILLQRRANTKHIKIQMDAIQDFVHRDSLRIYQDLINNRLETPDISKAEGIVFKNALFNTSTGDSTQTLAVKKAIGNKNVLLIQGPPGTGKTSIIVEIIEQLVAQNKKVLVCSQAHAAVKNIFDRLQSRAPKMKLLTLDEKDEVTAATRKFDEEAYTLFLKNNITILSDYSRGAEKTELFERINTFTYNYPIQTKDFKEKHRHVIDFNEVIEGIQQQKITFLLDRLKRETRNLNTDLLNAQVYREKDVILGTCIGIGMDPVMRDKDAVHFDTVIVDEAGKANLAETIVPLQLGERFILVGDHRQLPPYFDREEIADYRDVSKNNPNEQSYSQEDVEKALNKSLFSDFFDHEYFPEENKITLNYQFRMNPQIGQYISDLFYGGKLLSGAGTEKQTVTVEGYPDPVTFVDTFVNKNNLNEENDPYETKSPEGSWYNMREIKDICEKILPKVSVTLEADPELTIGIITPYKAQYRKLKETLKDSRFKDSIYTIDSIQGSEFDIVVFSFVRAFSGHSNKKVGFLDDLRRLNVSLSRAKKKLILVGHLPTLKNPAAHIDTHIEGMVRPVEVFSSIASRIKRFGDLSPIEQFMELHFEEGHLFEDCEFHDEEPAEGQQERNQTYIVIHLDGFDLETRVPKKLFNKCSDGDTIEVVLSGFDATGRPQFESADSYSFRQKHKEGEAYCATVTRTNEKEDGRIVVYAEVDGYELPMRLPAYIREEHPEFLEIGTKLTVQLGHNENDPNHLYCQPNRSEAERILGSRIQNYKFTATLAAREKYPVITLCCNDGSSLSLSCPMLWYTGIEEEKYDLVLLKDRNCKLNDHYYFDFINNHKKGSRYTGLVVAEDEDNFFVEVDDYCGIIEKKWNKKRGVEIDSEYSVMISWLDFERKLVKFMFV